ncbi:hypothetical protein L207DRAFT_574416 [Hyaloscypha variabilis F]|uniref:RING-type domain-containing protein n=1 Tax=Hyaloscypha variabilis (strain UAMH 11265 / GT02V1 / F) TaxID=1149755 RepID=A0A2J6QS99_HYAVF|nr:hypothetical protein L207DRAFT_574416 [Hyaloscypha variabilis F]
MKFSWSASRSNSGSSDDPETGDVALQNIPRQSHDSGGHNRDAESPSPDHGERILQEIRTGRYTCTICLDPLTPGTTYEHSLWACLSCHTVTHFRCAKSWFEASNQNSILPSLLVPRIWKCPSCQLEYLEPRARCWCLKHAFGSLATMENNTDRPNACTERCERVRSCVHGVEKNCLKICHPGPCNMPCDAGCADAPIVRRTPGRWARLRARVRQRETGTLRFLAFMLGLLFLIYTLLGVFCFWHVRWWSQPYRYTEWRSFDGVGFAECMFLLLVGVCFIMPAIGILLFGIGKKVLEVGVLAFNVKSREARYAGLLPLVLIGAGIWMLPIIGFAGGPDIAWYNQMKDTCNGLDTRIAMYTSGRFEVKSLFSNVPTYEMYLGSQLKPVLEPGVGNNTNAIHPFETFQRLSISRPSSSSPNSELEHIAIDIDIPHHLYRIMHLNTSDIENAYLATYYKHISSLTTLPTFHPISETLISNGTFTPVNATEKHMLIPELNIGISNMHDFISDYAQEPFVKIYQNLAPYSRSPPIASLSEKEAFHATLSEDWDSRKMPNWEHEVVMRTASFGHGRQRLDVCVREDEEVREGGLRSLGVYEDLWIPFAVLASYRQRMYEIGEGSGVRGLKRGD